MIVFPGCKSGNHQPGSGRDPEWKTNSTKGTSPAIRHQHHVLVLGLLARWRDFCGTLTRNACPQANQGRASDKPKLREILHHNWPVLFKSAKVMKHKERQKMLDVVGHKETQAHAVWDPELGLDTSGKLVKPQSNLCFGYWCYTNGNFLVLSMLPSSHRMLIKEKLGWKVYKNSVYFCNLSVRLKLFWNKSQTTLRSCTPFYLTLTRF